MIDDPVNAEIAHRAIIYRKEKTMKLDFIKLEDLETSRFNVRKHGEIAG